jgi:hypothetical protein
MTFDDQVAALRGKVTPQRFQGRKATATPEQWAAFMDWDAARREREREKIRARDRRLYAERPELRAASALRYKKWSSSLSPDERKSRYYSGQGEPGSSLRERRNEWRRRWQTSSYRSDPHYRMRRLLRQRLRAAMIGQTRPGSAVTMLGCSLDALRQHLESQFLPGMTWDNWTVDGWHLDHIRPLASFDLTDPAQCAEACHYTNLQPLWAADNLRKHSHWEAA